MLILILLSDISAPLSHKIISFIGQPEKAANYLHVWLLNCWGFGMRRHTYPKEDARAASDIYWDKPSRPQMVLCETLDSIYNTLPPELGKDESFPGSSSCFCLIQCASSCHSVESKSHFWKGFSNKSFNSHPELVLTAMKQGLSTEGIRCQAEEEGLEEFSKPWFAHGLQQGQLDGQRTALSPSENQENVEAEPEPE